MSLTNRLQRLVRLARLRTAAQRSLAIHLAPQQLLCVVRQGGRAIEGSAQQIAINNPNGHWQASVDVLGSLLRQYDAEWARLPLEIGLSSRWCQMLLAPWSDALLAEPSATRFLLSQMTALYGDAARTWSIACDDAPYGQARVTSGVDSALLQSLKEISTEYNHPCRAIEPALGLVLRLSVPRGGAMPAAVALVEAGRITMAALTGGRVTAIQSQPASTAWMLELPQAWQRWTLRAPELASFQQVAVINLDAVSDQALALPERFRLLDGPFGTPADRSMEEAA